MIASNTLDDIDGLGTISYQWQRDGIDVVGATTGTYLLDDLDVGTQITVLAYYTDLLGTAESVSSAATATVANVNDLPSGSVIITGTVTKGQMLTVDVSSLADNDGLGTLNYQWQHDGIDISGATVDSYTLGALDVGLSITVVVMYLDLHGTSESITSLATDAVADANSFWNIMMPAILNGGERSQ